MTVDIRPDWLQGPLGQVVLASESAAVERALAQIFGAHFLQVGSWGASSHFMQFAQTRCRSLVGDQLEPGIGAVSRPSRLAIATSSVDAVLLPHTLEMDPDPHQVLREVDRVLVGAGHLIVLGFNPWSTWGLRHLISRQNFPGGAHRLISEKRMRDWLALLGMEVSDCQRCIHVPPINHQSIQRRFGGLEQTGARFWPRFAGAYILVAQKRAHAVTPMRPQWSRRPRVIAGGLVKPTTRSAA